MNRYWRRIVTDANYPEWGIWDDKEMRYVAYCATENDATHILTGLIFRERTERLIASLHARE